ncbi:MAG: cell division protein FtsW [Sphingomonadales bacterium]|nr:MAG: cell division protein FtsW [Sphingomonadales bacterium]
MTLIGRSDQSLIGRWFWTIDRFLLLLLALLICIGVVAMLSASPSAALRYSGNSVRLPDLLYFYRHLGWIAIGVPVLLGVSMLPTRWLRRLCVLGLPILLLLLLALPVIGTEKNGAIRWITLGGSLVQPSEFLKPMLVVVTAWVLATRFEDPSVPALKGSAILAALAMGLLIIQPDFGQTALVGIIWFVQACLAGLPVPVIGGLAVSGVGLAVSAYLLMPHVRDRVQEWVLGVGDNFQADQATKAFQAGGLLGAGPSEGRVKFSLPEAHTDYIFAVAGEEFGMIACFCLALLYLGIIIRVALQLLDEEDPFVFLATAGLVAEFGVQAFINMSVNLSLLPSKGMTLPFISHGGSSFIAMAFTMGMVLAFTRGSRALRASPFAPRSLAGALA